MRNRYPIKKNITSDIIALLKRRKGNICNHYPENVGDIAKVAVMLKLPVETVRRFI